MPPLWRSSQRARRARVLYIRHHAPHRRNKTITCAAAATAGPSSSGLWHLTLPLPALRPSRLLQHQCGSPHHVAPEVLTGKEKGYCGRKADVWSVGLCLYVLLVGRMPFVAAETLALFDLIRVGKYELPYTLPSTALDCLSRMLCVDPAARWDVAQLRTHGCSGWRAPRTPGWHPAT